MTPLEIGIGGAIIIVSVLLCIVVFDRDRTEKGGIRLPVFDAAGGADKNRPSTGREKHDNIVKKLFAVYAVFVIICYLLGAKGA